MKSEKQKIQSSHFGWLDSIRGIAILWIFLVHFIERFMSGSYFANPGASWPSLGERFAQLAPLGGPAVSAIVANALRYVGWLGDQGVQLFLVASGFGLTYSALRRSQKIEFLPFLKRRLVRIIPEWWAVHILFIITFILIGFGLQPTSWRTALSFIGVRFLPSTMYYFSPAWWFIGLLIQLYLIFPFLFRFIQGGRMIRRIVLLIVGAVVIRTVGLLIFDQYLDWWSRGAIFISRLPDFAFGMLFAVLLGNKPYLIERYTKGLRGFLLWFAVWMLGNIASFFLIGMSVAFLLTAAGLFMLIYMAANSIRANKSGPVKWLGRNSYSFFLIHHPILIAIVPATLSVFATGRVFVLLLVTAGLSLVLGLILNRGTSWGTSLLFKWRETGGYRRVLFRIFAVLVMIAAVFISVELGIRALAPQEVLGWGERVSLVPDREMGYKLKPDSEHRLRWLSYDYRVESNELGFPGPLYPEEKAPNTLRIFVTGDAFESAEGVDTRDAWPRLLEDLIDTPDRKVQVLNFSITGWGPQHYERAVTKYTPRYNPDVIIVGFFVNEFYDIQSSDYDYISRIGFNKPDQSSIYYIFKMVHTKEIIQRFIIDRLNSIISGKLTRQGESFTNLAVFERRNLPGLAKGVELIKEHMQSILDTANELGSRLLVVLVPSSIQVCEPEDLSYLTRGVDPASSEEYNLDQPQRLAKKIFDELNIEYFDLRPALSRVDECPYQSRNMHWTEYGHQLVAQVVADELKAKGWTGQ